MQPMDERFAALIRSYLPGWQAQPDSGQPEAALLYAAWRLLQDTRGRMAYLPLKHEQEFLDAWPMDPAPAQPMRAYAALHAPEGQHIPTGSELYLSGSGTRLWRTTQPVSAESLQLQQQVLENIAKSKLIRLPGPNRVIPTRLFDFRSKGQEKYAARFAHPDALRSALGCQVTLHFPVCDDALLDTLADPACVLWRLEKKDGRDAAIQPPRREGKNLFFALPGCPDAVALSACLQAGVKAPSQIMGQVQVSSQRKDRVYTAAITNDETITAGGFYPFGFSTEPWRSCYVACPDVLALPGARVTVIGSLSAEMREEKLPGMDKEPEYRSIMRRMPAPPPPFREVAPQSVVWEYWNGSGWLPIPETRALLPLFGEKDDARTFRAEFTWPEDACPCQVQGQEACWLRWRITRADGLGWLPVRVHIPIVGDLRMSAVLERAPVEITVRTGLDPEAVPVENARGSRLFPPQQWSQDGWWLCFDHGPAEDQLSLYLELASRMTGSVLTAWEDTPDGMKKLTLTDGTDGLAHSGLLLLSGINGKRTRRFHQAGWWICLRDDGETLSRGYGFPALVGLYPGTVCLQAEGKDSCQTGEQIKPLRGGALTGETLTESFGGSAAEEPDSLLLRAEKYRHHLGRGVSALDVEQLVQFHFRDVIRTSCCRKDDQVEVAVLMRDAAQHSAAFAQQKENIAHLLEQNSSVPTLGLGVSVREPNFYPVQATIWMRSAQQQDFQTDSERLGQLVQQFLNPVTGKFRGDGWRIGEMPSEQELRNYLMIQLPGITLVKILLTAVTPEGREVECTAVQDPFALPTAGKTIVYEVRGEDLA